MTPAPHAINPKHLRAFLAVSQTGSVVRSSQRLRRVQSAITRAIQELERELGVTLFERRPQGMLLTGTGHTLLHRVERAFAEMESARRGIAAAGPPAGWNEAAPIFSLSLGRQRLLAFAELVEQRHMGAVADSLMISQPAVSQALREVEIGLGIEVFIRSPAGLQPTPLGALLALHVRRALAEIRAAEVEIGLLQGAMAGRVTVGTLSLGRDRLLPRAILGMQQHHPNLSVTTLEGTFEHLSMRLRAGDIDFILGALRPPEHTIGLLREPIAEDEMALVVRAGHPLARRGAAVPAAVLAALAASRWVLPQRGTPTRELLEGALRARGLPEPAVTVETTDLTITRGLLLDSDMVTAVSPHLFQHEIGAKSLAVLPFEMPETRRAIGFLQRAGGSPSLAARMLMDSIRAVGRL
ncbi:LysR family transcriptional regulator [Roseomonas populi]|uniref:LysR family transcriptional regulator n=1 Tax=Roseomonas populi TaxID=3121582 RepID=A0ABT1X789_9PROT|nr:LysR family transcriptional regulator [Roseomonas pecuniae]MCR0983966.1 LysR family transcriptional regulator [Roseomonas pecuniae]